MPCMELCTTGSGGCGILRSTADMLDHCTDPYENGCGGEAFRLCVMCHDADQGRRPEFRIKDRSEYVQEGYYDERVVCERQEQWCTAHRLSGIQERALCLGSSGGCRVNWCGAIDGIPHGRHYREGQPCLECREMMWELVSIAKPLLSKSHAQTSDWTSARAQMFPPPLSVSQRTYLDIPFADNDDFKALGGKWDRARRSWYVPEGKILAPFLARWRNRH